MKKFLFAFVFATLFISNTASARTEAFGKVGIDKINVLQNSSTSLQVTPTFFSSSQSPEPVILELSIVDTRTSTTSGPVIESYDMITSTILDSSYVVPANEIAAGKTYTYTFPSLPKKNTYKVELRLFDTNRNRLYVRQSSFLTLGSENLSNISLVDWFQVDGKEYSVTDGPIVSPDKKDTAFYVFQVNNASSQPVVISTEYSSRKYASLGAEYVKNESQAPVTVAAKSKLIVKVPAKYFDETGTYEGLVSVYAGQADKKVLLKTEEFRYMNGDAFVTVTEAKLSTSTITLDIAKTMFDSTVDLTDEVLNSTSTNDAIKVQDAKEYVFTFSYVAADKSVVSSQDVKMKWADLQLKTEFPATLTSVQKGQITAVQVIVKNTDGKVVFKNEFPVSVQYEALSEGGIQTIIIVIGLVLLILSMIGFLVTRNKVWLLFVILFLGGTLFAKYSNIFATTYGVDGANFQITDFTDGGNDPDGTGGCGRHGYTGLTMGIYSYPSPSDVFQCGGTATVRLDPINGTCSNTPAATYFVYESSVGISSISGIASLTPGAELQTYTRQRAPWTNEVSATALVVQFATGFSGNATLTGHYRQVNGACSSQTGSVTFTFKNVNCTQTCSCDGRTNKCTSGAIQTNTPNAPECKPQASCGVSVNGDQATFTTSATHILGTASYKDTPTGQTITSSVVKTIPAGGSVTQNTTVTDSFDGLTAAASCSATRNSITTTCSGTDCPATSTVTTVLPTISRFLARPAIVNKGDSCKFSWDTTGMTSCSFKVNGVELSSDKSVIDITVLTTDGNNKNGILTCVGSTTPATMVVATTSCYVNPEVRQQ